MVTGIYLSEYLAHGTSRVGWIGESGVEYLQNSIRVFSNICHSPFISGIKFHLYSIFINFINIVEVCLPVFIVYVRNWFVFLFVHTCQINFAINLLVYLHFVNNVLVCSFELLQPFNYMLLNVKKTIEHLRRLNIEVLSPFQNMRSSYNNPVILVGIHGCIC